LLSVASSLISQYLSFTIIPADTGDDEECPFIIEYSGSMTLALMIESSRDYVGVSMVSNLFGVSDNVSSNQQIERELYSTSGSNFTTKPGSSECPKLHIFQPYIGRIQRVVPWNAQSTLLGYI
jgi:hypothetical protein